MFCLQNRNYESEKSSHWDTLKYIAEFKVNRSISLIRYYIDAYLYTPRPAYPPCYFKRNSSRDRRLTATTCPIPGFSLYRAYTPFDGSLVDDFLIWRANTRFIVGIDSEIGWLSAIRKRFRGRGPGVYKVSSGKRSSFFAPSFFADLHALHRCDEDVSRGHVHIHA